MTKTALVSGASGFVGSHLVDHLRGKGWGVRALLRRSSDPRWLPAEGIERVYGDATDPQSLAPAVKGADVVFHVAGVTRAKVEAEYLRVNAQGTGNLVRVSRDAGVGRFVLVSSLAAGGPSSLTRPRREEDEDRPTTDYGRSKREGERELIRHAGDLPWTILRPPAVYGPRDTGFFLLVRFAAKGWRVRFTGPVQPVSVIHVQDLVQGITAASLADTTVGNLYYTANRQTTDWGEVVSLMAQGVGRRTRDLVIPLSMIPWLSRGAGLFAALSGRDNPIPEDRIRDLFVKSWTCDSARGRKDFGFEASVDLAAGMQETMQWYRQEGWI